MRRIRLTVAYDGTNYHGWQVQPGVVTIESVLNEALTELFGEEIAVIGASRTDSGVHARGMWRCLILREEWRRTGFALPSISGSRRISGYRIPVRFPRIGIPESSVV